MKTEINFWYVQTVFLIAMKLEKVITWSWLIILFPIYGFPIIDIVVDFIVLICSKLKANNNHNNKMAHLPSLYWDNDNKRMYVPFEVESEE